MKEIGKDKFELLYDKLIEHLEKNGGVMKTVGIKQGTTNQALSEMWQMGKKWETIALIIAYHYSRNDSLLLKLPGSVSLISRGKSFTEIQRILGIKNGETSECIITEEEFEEEFDNLWEMFRGEKNISPILDKLGITEKSLLINYWKQDYKWETITAIIAYKRLESYKRVIIRTEHGEFKFNEADYYEILETIQFAFTKA